MLKSIFGHVKTVVHLGKNENNYNMLFEDSQFDHIEVFEKGSDEEVGNMAVRG